MRILTTVFFTTVITIFCLAFKAQAHDFWIAPNAYHLSKPAQTDVNIMVGHPRDRTKWASDAHRVTAFKSVGSGGITDQQISLKDFAKNQHLRAKLTNSGTHVVAIETSHTKNILSAANFNAYLDEEGLTLIKQARARTDTRSTVGRERYSRRGKALIQVGELDPISDLVVTKPLGLTLEIVPTNNPYRLKVEEDMQLQIFYRGAAAQGVQIKLVSLDTIVGTVATAKTNADGLVSFKRPPSGNWMVHAVWSTAMENNKDANYDTVFSSLSFGFN